MDKYSLVRLEPVLQRYRRLFPCRLGDGIEARYLSILGVRSMGSGVRVLVMALLFCCCCGTALPYQEVLCLGASE